MDFKHVRPEHVCHPIEKVAEKHREALQSCCDTLEKEQVKGEQSLKNVADAKKILKNTADNAKEEISKQRNNIIKAVEDVFRIKINEVDELHAKVEEQLTGQSDKVESFLDKVKHAANMSKNLLEKGSDEEIMESQKMVEERVGKVKQESQAVQNLQKPATISQSWFTSNQLNQIKIESVLNIFGEVCCDVRVFPNSSILKQDKHVQQMTDWFGNEKWQLCYRATTDGWSADDFHSKCDNKPPTVVLVKVDDFIFGGYTDTDWQPKAGSNVKTSKNAFLFSLKNKDNLPPFKSAIMVVKRATVANKNYGAIFGTGDSTFDVDLCISGLPLTEKSRAQLGNTYKLPNGYKYGTEKANNLLAGSCEFTPSEIEVFYQDQ